MKCHSIRLIPVDAALLTAKGAHRFARAVDHTVAWGLLSLLPDETRPVQDRGNRGISDDGLEIPEGGRLLPMVWKIREKDMLYQRVKRHLGSLLKWL